MVSPILLRFLTFALIFFLGCTLNGQCLAYFPVISEVFACSEAES